MCLERERERYMNLLQEKGALAIDTVSMRAVCDSGAL